MTPPTSDGQSTLYVHDQSDTVQFDCDWIRCIDLLYAPANLFLILASYHIFLNQHISACVSSDSEVVRKLLLAIASRGLPYTVCCHALEVIIEVAPPVLLLILLAKLLLVIVLYIQSR